ncbi:septum site-determining protein MinC [Beggiatoa leptomitoformis]|uniref:Probable septum site-determining protein MinC n=1 Tax=Beggiatoa leptomitoformis TaxID=288004 RepID=A0A2N9YG92_9GAMM|nr:septum site-determining protein MinC [Beggiatoa leptomitoformis]ALG68189.1 septum site-determining protein MinC [Beggiatoa leptomitoformis]AUI69507.1 septum site-determining protein MinC [Beggiatoa leptomitoformis]
MFSNSSETQSPAIELKGNLLTVMVLRLLDTNQVRITEQLIDKVSQAPSFFQNAPVIVDLSTLNHEDDTLLNLKELILLLRQQGLVPVAVRGGVLQYHEVALQLSLGVLPESQRAIRPKREPLTVVAPANLSPPPMPKVPFKVVTQPIRSGQQVVAPQGDLIVLATVSPGAEILAQRHIHVYGALRGRALAGVNGDTDARIFCQHLDAELVSVAGHYQINEELKEHVRGKPAQIYLENDKLKIHVLDIFSKNLP